MSASETRRGVLLQWRHHHLKMRIATNEVGEKRRFRGRGLRNAGGRIVWSCAR